jgi:hypothetical protein
MRMMKKKLIVGLLASGLVIFGFNGCKKINPVEGVEMIVDGTFSEASVSFQFVDAKTGKQLDINGADNLAISITGKNAADIVDNVGNTALKAGSGILAVGTKMGVMPSTTNAVEFEVHATANGYLPASTSVNIVQTGHSHYIVKMVDINNAPAGISVATANTTSNSQGIVNNTLTVSPNAGSSGGYTAEVTVPSGTKLFDKNNTAVTGTITGTLAYYNPTQEGVLENFPGLPMSAKVAGGKYAIFNTMGFVSMQINNQNGREVKSFGTPIQMRMEIPDGATDNDGNPITSGKTLEVWSYDDTKGEWKKESNTTAQLNSTTGKLEASFNMNHLSYWQVTESMISPINTYTKVNFSGNCKEFLATTHEIEISWYYNGYVTYTLPAVINFSNPVYVVYGVNSNAFVNGIYKYRWSKTGSSDIVEVDAVHSGEVNVQFPASWCPVEIVKEFDITLTTSCPDRPDRKIKPQCTVFAIENGDISTLWIPVGQMNNGVLKTSTGVLKKNKKYALVCFYQDKFVSLTGKLSNPFDLGSVTITGETIDLSRPLTDAECKYLRKITG